MNRFTHHSRSSRKTQNGSIALSTAIVVFLSVLVAALTMYAQSTALASYYHNKIHTLALNAVVAYRDELDWNGVVVSGSSVAAAQSTALSAVNSALAQMGLPAGTLSITDNGKQYVLTLTVAGLASMDNCVLFPTVLNVQETVEEGYVSPVPGIISIATPGSAPVYMPASGLYLTPYSDDSGNPDLRTTPPGVAAFYKFRQQYHENILTFTGADTFTYAISP